MPTGITVTRKELEIVLKKLERELVIRNAIENLLRFFPNNDLFRIEPK
jgi:hypothetical protein